jgi:hypothetical protein
MEDGKEKINVLPRRFWGDPADCVDELRRLSEFAKRQALRDRRHKSLRIQASVKKAMKGEHHGV